MKYPEVIVSEFWKFTPALTHCFCVPWNGTESFTFYINFMHLIILIKNSEKIK